MKNEEWNFSHQSEKRNLTKKLFRLNWKRKTCKFWNWIFLCKSLCEIEVFCVGKMHGIAEKFKWENYILSTNYCSECKIFMCPSIELHEYSASFYEARSNNLISGNYRHMIAISSFPSPLSWTPPKPIGSIKSDRISYYFLVSYSERLALDVEILILSNKQDYSFALLRQQKKRRNSVKPSNGGRI